jgi:hypothetical protein
VAKSVTVTVTVRGRGDGLDHTDTFTYTNSNAPQSYYTQAAAGFNGPWVSGVFPGMEGAVVVPPRSTSGVPSKSGVGKTLVGSGSDTGIPLLPEGWQVVPVAPGSGGFGLNYSSGEPLYLVLF